MRTLFLHVGHGKTGSTYLQNTFSKNTGRLLEHGIHYPNPKPVAYADNGGRNSGNTRGASETLAALEAYLADASKTAENLFVSGEVLFHNLPKLRTDEGDPAALPAMIAKLGFDRTCILLFIRDPLDHAASVWQQTVKNHGLTERLERFLFRKKANAPGLARHFLHAMQDMSNTQIEIHNYSRVRSRLIEVATDWLGLPAGTLAPPKLAVHNRGMTTAELAFLQILNRVDTDAARTLADALRHRVPRVDAPKIPAQMPAQQRFLREIRPDMDWINARVPEAHAYRADLLPTPEAGGALNLSADQIAVIVDVLYGRSGEDAQRAV